MQTNFCVDLSIVNHEFSFKFWKMAKYAPIFWKLYALCVKKLGLLEMKKNNTVQGDIL